MDQVGRVALPSYILSLGLSYGRLGRGLLGARTRAI